MHPVEAFLIGLAVTATLAFTVVWYMRAHMKAILVDLCGTEARADFWMAFTNVTMILVPLVFAMQFHPEPAEGSLVAVHFVGQLKWALIGLVTAVALLGIVLTSFIFGGPASKAPGGRSEVR